MTSKPLIIAHRGCRSLAPENTLPAAQKGLETGADLWETDVSVTRDGEMVIFHDADLTRTTNAEKIHPGRAPWLLSDYSLSDIRKLDAGAWFTQTDPFRQISAGKISGDDLASYTNEPPPTLKEALSWTKRAGWRVNLELKQQPKTLDQNYLPRQTLETIDRLNIDPGRVVISSFHHDWLHDIRKRRPEIEVQALIGKNPYRPLSWGNMEFLTYNVNYKKISPDKVRELSEKGYKINLFTVNGEADMRRYLDTGAAGIITDFPQRLKRILNE